MSRDNEQLNVTRQSQKTNTIQLSDKETYKLSYSASPDMFELNDTRSSKEITASVNILDTKMTSMIKSDKKVEYAARRQVQVDRFREVSRALYKDRKWYSFFNAESPEMVRVKKTLAYLNNLLDKEISEYIDREGEKGAALRADDFKEAVHKAFEEVTSACENYLEKKRNAKQGRWSTGIRRMELVNRILRMCKEEKNNYEFTIEALKENSIEGFDISQLVRTDEKLQEDVHQDVKEENKQVYNLHTLSAMHRHTVAVETDWQNQGNSTDVYRIVAKEKEGDVVYYIKENLPLISSDIDGFLTRRMTELESSKKAHDEKNEEKEELRMREAKMEASDYDACTRFLKAIQDKINSAPAADRIQVRKRMVDLFAHDFDRIFKNLHSHNAAAKILDKGGEFDLGKWVKAAGNKDNPEYEVACILLKHMGYNLDGKKINGADDENGQKKEELKVRGENEWIIGELGLNMTTDKNLIDIINNLYGNEQNGKAIENLFRISLGKEVELFGQMRDRTDGDVEEVTATNNTATSRLAARTKFSDVVTVSESRIVKFTDRNGKQVEKFCTVMKEAQGQEFLDILQKASKNGKKIEYTPEVIRQLMRLNAFDLLCLQVDRHGRNFKCKTTEKDGKIIITSIMSYDHDMSFGEKSLSDSFKDGKDAGFLKNPVQVIKKDSPMYRYVAREYFKLGHSNSFLDDIREPDWDKLMNEFKKTSRFRVILQKLDLNNFIVSPFRNEDYIKMRLNIVGNNLDESNSSFSGIIKNKDGGKLEDDGKEVASELGEVFGKLKGIVYDAQKKELKSELSKEEKKNLRDALYKLYELDTAYDFSNVVHKDTSTSGLLTLWIKKTLFTYSELLRSDRRGYTIEDMIDEEEITEEEKARKKNALKNITDSKTKDLVIPAILHFDLAAYNAIIDMKDSLDKNTGDITGDLKGLGFREAKIDKLKQRCNEMIEMVENAKLKAEAFYGLAGWTSDTVQGKFFLEEKDYKKLKNLSELSVDPGQTYLSIDNENYLLGNQEYQKLASDAMKLRALEAEKKKQTDSKRGKNPDYLKNEVPADAMKKFLNNPLSGNISA